MLRAVDGERRVYGPSAGNAPAADTAAAQRCARRRGRAGVRGSQAHRALNGNDGTHGRPTVGTRTGPEVTTTPASDPGTSPKSTPPRRTTVTISAVGDTMMGNTPILSPDPATYFSAVSAPLRGRPPDRLRQPGGHAHHGHREQVRDRQPWCSTRRPTSGAGFACACRPVGTRCSPGSSDLRWCNRIGASSSRRARSFASRSPATFSRSRPYGHAAMRSAQVMVTVSVTQPLVLPQVSMVSSRTWVTPTALTVAVSPVRSALQVVPLSVDVWYL
jgi:hypothetical protein